MALIKLNSRAIPDDTVVEADIADGSVTSAKLDTNIDVAGTLDVTGVLTADSNVQVGKTSSDYQAVGVEAKTNGSLWATADGNGPLIVVRKTSDGTLADFYKDTTKVGSIGAKFSGRSYIASGTSANTGVRFDTNFIAPADATGANRDNAINLGSSGDRFKDLYLSSSVYLGGTAAANALDDYEEGSFTPTLSGEGSCNITLSSALGQYNKVGRIVNVTMFFQVSAVSGGSSGLAVNLGNLPFITNTNLNTTGSVRAQNLNTGLTANALQVSIYNNSDSGRIEEWTGATATNLSDHVTSNSNFAVSVTYSIT